MSNGLRERAPSNLSDGIGDATKWSAIVPSAYVTLSLGIVQFLSPVTKTRIYSCYGTSNEAGCPCLGLRAFLWQDDHAKNGLKTEWKKRQLPSAPVSR
jgi:hypothetical protein